MNLRRIFAHRAKNREEVSGSRSDVVAVACIVAAQRPVGTSDDALGAFDDSVNWRTEQFVESIVDPGRTSRHSSGRLLLALAGPAETCEASVSRRHDLSIQDNSAALVRPAARALTGETASRRK